MLTINIARKHINRLAVKIDSENAASLRVIEKFGAREGGRLKKEYGLARDKGVDGIVPEDKLRDVLVWFVDRPGEVEGTKLSDVL